MPQTTLLVTLKKNFEISVLNLEQMIKPQAKHIAQNKL